MVRIKKIRLRDYDYKSNGYYFVTVVTDNRQRFLLDSELMVKQELQETTQIPGLQIDYYVIMPDHVHIIFILENCRKPLGEIVRRFKAKVSHRLGQKVWQPNYYEHVIRTEKALDQIREYVVNNPAAELLKFNQFYK